MERLPAAVVVDGGPRDDGPAVVELPVEGSHGLGAEAAHVLDAELNCLSLHELAQVDEGRKIAGGAELSLEVLLHVVEAVDEAFVIEQRG